MDLVESGTNTVGLDRRHPWELARIEVVKRVLRERVDLHPGDMVLDVGCGDSFLVEQIAASYPSVTFCGIDTAFDEHLLGMFTRNLKVGNVQLFRTLEDAASKIRDKQAAVVLLLDVIEHVQDDVAFLKSLQTSPLVGPHTRYVVSVPAFECLFSTHDVFLGHYRRYSNRTLERHLKRAGLEPQLLCYFFSSLLLPRLTKAAGEKLLRVKSTRTTAVASWRGSKALQRFIKQILVWDFRVTWALNRRGINVPGLSNLALCRTAALSSADEFGASRTNFVA
jgi:2-polyprenyl-3-methyl-5-hydroxy-6-metoxy-1,4-benzoquinol methylase